MTKADDAKALGRRVSARMEKMKISQQRLAAATKMTQGGIWNIVNGEVARPRALPELARALNTTQQWLLNGTGTEEVFHGNPVIEIDILDLINRLSGEQQDEILKVLMNNRLPTKRNPDAA